ncbi:hypothetical protein LA303_00855 [Candidatus Sulfidibacterium hydrothermale]|uniref:hypothetical protein n=1 Tax=Candidatus Sulfidibacterium hydrothermale TaxID=2875962 RepID=UPI001F0B1A94|nr:hypothetical protein [Candidatus Sulfidibacterium hydrothermale]UBM62545.1 hypothetical protein LA303_00855 [Candidatus Sulfidibacterium hydrothermale]
MIYALIIYMLSVAIPARKNYLHSSQLSIGVKAIHLIITSILFIYYFSNFRMMLWNLFRNGTEGFYTIKGVYAYNKSTDLIISILFFAISFFVSGLALNLAVRAKSRKLLLLTSPLIIIATSFDLYKFTIIESISEKDNLFLLFIILFIGIFFGLINLFYNIKPGKNIFRVGDS